VFRADIRGEPQLVDYIDGKGGTRTLDPGIMRTGVKLKHLVNQLVMDQASSQKAV
jgi:hypothetical protein